MTYRTDFHVHTRYSDGGGWPEEYIGNALAAGLSEIGFSDHLTLTETQQEWSMKTSLLEEYCERIERIRSSGPGLIIRTGLEVDYFPGKEEEIRKTICNLPLDYVIGSVHYMGNGPVDFGREYYEGKDIDGLFSDYFDLVAEAAATGLFDIMGHPDLVRIFRHSPSADPEPLYRKLAGRMAEFDVVCEVNTNGYNKPLNDIYPDHRFLNLFRESGVAVCVNSDAHKPSLVGQYFDEAYRLLKEAGFTELALFEGRKRSLRPID